jgi:hypothetical protein
MGLLRKISGPKSEELTGSWEKWYKKELDDG